MTQPQSEATPAEAARSGRLPLGRLLLGLAVLALLFALGRGAGAYLETFRGWVESLGSLGPIVFIAGYALAVVAFVPGAALTLAGGAIFGVGPGSVFVFVAAVIGSSAAFLVARYAARGAVARRVARDPRFAAIDSAIGAHGRKIIFLLRLSPVFPFNVLNYALGMTSVRFVDYAIASLGMIPGTLLYVYLGAAAGEAVAAGAGANRTPAEYALFAVGLVATIAVTAIVTRIARRALKEATDG